MKQGQIQTCARCGMYIREDHPSRYCVLEDHFLHSDCDMYMLEGICKFREER